MVPLNRRRAVYAACALAALTTAGPARASSSGLHIDPNSPPGKEYAIPIQAARGQGDGAAPAAAQPAAQPAAPSPAAAPSRAVQPSPGVRSAPSTPATPRPQVDSGLFGAGISRAARGPASHRRARPAAAAPSPAPQPVLAADRRPVPAGGLAVLVFWVGAALALLVPGLAVGIGVRRWRRD
jgi:hypothetical protein